MANFYADLTRQSNMTAYIILLLFTASILLWKDLLLTLYYTVLLAVYVFRAQLLVLESNDSLYSNGQSFQHFITAKRNTIDFLL